MPSVFRIGYVEFGSTQMEAELAYYKDVIGATAVETGPGGAHYLSLGLDHHNIALRPAAQPGLQVTGYQLGANVSLSAMFGLLTEAGLKPVQKQDSRPGVPALVAADVCGFNFEFFAENAMPAPGFGKAGIVPNRLGHVAYLSPEAPKLIGFFTDILGFYKTDWFEDVATFLTCNHDHHVLNIIHAPVTKLHHIAFEMRGGSHQYVASDQLARAKLPIVWGPSRHTAGHNYASYHYDPDHTLVELYADMDVFLPDLGFFEPRPWHEHLPQRPRVWPLSELNGWHTNFEFQFSAA
jgi:catechol-2,3-dioxygenase